MSAHMPSDGNFQLLEVVPGRMECSPAVGRRNWPDETNARIVAETLTDFWTKRRHRGHAQLGPFNRLRSAMMAFPFHWLNGGGYQPENEATIALLSGLWREPVGWPCVWTTMMCPLSEPGPLFRLKGTTVRS
ncbi:hypothetical protein [Devosia sp. A449]